MKPNEFSEQLKNPETNQEYVELCYKKVTELLDGIGKYRYVLEEGLFLDDENGGVEFRTGKMRIPDSGKEIDAIEVFFKGADYVSVPLGAIIRSGNNFDKVSVWAYYLSRETKLDTVQADRYQGIDIFDTRWEAVVGSVEAVFQQLESGVLPRNLERFKMADFVEGER
ncbi:MAG: hypothetical protein ACM3KH_00050 [Thiobacillus sp.]